MNKDLSKELLKSGDETDDQAADVSTPQRKGDKIKTPALYYEYSESPDPRALSQAYEILFEEVLRIRKSKK